jgi:hypothetical protein
VKKPGADRASSHHNTQRDAERRAKDILRTLAAARRSSTIVMAVSAIRTPFRPRKIRSLRATPSTRSDRMRAPADRAVKLSGCRCARG